MILRYVMILITGPTSQARQLQLRNEEEALQVELQTLDASIRASTTAIQFKKAAAAAAVAAVAPAPSLGNFAHLSPGRPPLPPGGASPVRSTAAAARRWVIVEFIISDLYHYFEPSPVN